MIVITREDLQGWRACSVGYSWFNKTFPSGEATLSEFLEQCPEKVWIAWTMYRSGNYWPDSRYTTAIADALVETGNTIYLYLTCKNWPDSRYTTAIADALVKTGDTEYLYYAGKNWPDSRYTTAISDALVETGNAYYLGEAGEYWPDSRKKDLMQ